MFQEALLESCPMVRARNRRSMLAAFAAETMVASLLVILPLFSTGIINTSSHIPLWMPVTAASAAPPHDAAQQQGSGSAAADGLSTTVVSVSNTESRLDFDHLRHINRISEPGPALPAGTGGNDSTIQSLLAVAQAGPSVQRLRLSHLSEGMLLYKVQPVYPPAAIPARIHGEVELHALIARDGSIQSLTAVSGHPLLVRAALEAVRQWRYRPYILNGQPVEVETFITVNFRPEN